MIGKILDYSIKDSKGVISAEDGNRYEFENKEWKSQKAPKVNQSVDFIVESEKAVSIYLTNVGKFDTDEALDATKEALGDAKDKFDEFRKSEAVTEKIDKSKMLFKKGIQQKYGFFLTLALLISYFIPVIYIPYIGNFPLTEGTLGTWVILALLGLLVMFYTDVERNMIRIASALVVGMITVQFWDLFSGLSDVNSVMEFGNRGTYRSSRSTNAFELLRLGTILVIPLTILLAFAGLGNGKKKKVKV